MTSDPIDALVESFRQQYKVPAVMLGIKGAIDLNFIVRGYGTLEPDGVGPAPAPTTVFEIGSVTKTFTGAALAWLSARKLLALEEPVQRRVPEYERGGVTLPVWSGTVPPGTSEIRFEDLADFAPGLPADGSGHAVPGERHVAELFPWVSEHPDLLNRYGTAPGSTYSYADAAFELLGSALAWVSRGSFEYAPLLRDLLETGGLPMRDTVIDLSDEQRSRLAPGYGNGDSIPYTPGEWLIKSTMSDMMVWLDFSMGQMSSPLSGLLPVIFQPRFTIPEKGVSTGLGWFMNPLSPAPGMTRYSKNGVAEGYSSYIAFLQGPGVPQTIGLVILTNQRNAKPPQLGNAILNVLSGAPPGPPEDLPE